MPGEDAPVQAESCGIHLENREVPEGVCVGVEEPVVEDAVRLAINPLPVGPVVGLGRPVLDAVAERVLPLVGSGKVAVFEDEHCGASDEGGGEHGQRQPVQADARRLYGCHLIRLGHYPEADQGCHQNTQGEHEKGDLRGKVCVIVEDDTQSDVVPDHVADQLEKVEDHVNAGEG